MLNYLFMQSAIRSTGVCVEHTHTHMWLLSDVRCLVLLDRFLAFRMLNLAGFGCICCARNSSCERAWCTSLEVLAEWSQYREVNQQSQTLSHMCAHTHPHAHAHPYILRKKPKGDFGALGRRIEKTVMTIYRIRNARSLPLQMRSALMMMIGRPVTIMTLMTVVTRRRTRGEHNKPANAFGLSEASKHSSVTRLCFSCCCYFLFANAWITIISARVPRCLLASSSKLWLREN